MANNTISPASLEARFERILMEVPLALQSGTMCLQLDGKKHEKKATIQVFILCSSPQVVHRAVQILKRDLGSHLLHLQHNDTAVCAQLRTLDLFSPSEALSFYHYHLQNALGNQAQVWLSTKGGIQ